VEEIYSFLRSSSLFPHKPKNSSSPPPSSLSSSSSPLPPYVFRTPHQFLIVSAANDAYVRSEMLQNFLCSLSLLPYADFLISRLVFLPLDSDTGTYVHNHYPLITSFDSSKYWHVDEGFLRTSSGATPSYFSYVIRKAIFLLKILETQNSDFLWTDSDLIWKQDPLPFFLGNGGEGEEEGGGCDFFFTDGVRWHIDFLKHLDPRVNAGFYYARNTENTKLLFRTWVTLLLEIQHKKGADKEQTTLNQVFAILLAKNQLQFHYPVDGPYPSTHIPGMVTICFLPMVEFPKWEELDDSQGKVVIAHANVVQKSSKDEELKRLGFWRLQGDGSCPEMEKLGRAKRDRERKERERKERERIDKERIERERLERERLEREKERKRERE